MQAALTALGRRPRRRLEPWGMLDLRDLHLTGAVLGGANLTSAVLAGTNLTSAVLQEANLTGAGLHGANLTGAEGLTQAQVEAGLGDAATRLPAGLERPASWTAGQEAVAAAAAASGAAPSAGSLPAPPAEHP